MTIADLIKWHAKEQARYAHQAEHERSTLPEPYKTSRRKSYARKAEFHAEAVRVLMGVAQCSSS